MTPAVLPHEAARLDALGRSRVLDTPSGGDFDELGALAVQVCGRLFAVLSLIASPVAEGDRVGMLCVMDRVPCTLPDEQTQALRELRL